MLYEIEQPVGESTASRQLPAWNSATAGLYLVAFSMAALAITGWRIAVGWEEQRTAERSAGQHFNRELVQAIEELSDRAGMLTNADYSPVRFRLRSGECPRCSPPLRPYHARLTRVDPNLKPETVDLPSIASGMIDFGLMEPGRYRLRLESPDGMWLEHEFDLLHGAPVDRIVRCPEGAPTGVEYRISLSWPAALSAHRLAAICRIEPAKYECDHWLWTPEEGLSGETVWCTNSPMTESDQGRLPFTGLPPGVGEQTVLIPLYTRHWELTEITFVRLPNPESHEDGQIIARAQFGSEAIEAPHSAASPLRDAPIWRVAATRPRWEAAAERDWNIELPPEVVDRLAQMLSETSSLADKSDIVRLPEVTGLRLATAAVLGREAE